MPIAPPDPLFVFHEGMESVFCLLFVVNDYEELIYAGTGDGEVHIWNLALNRRQNTIKIGENSCLQLHRTKEELFITQEKSGPTTVWLENVEDDHSRHWTRQLVISSSYAGFCRSVLLPWENWLVLPCGGSTLKVCCLTDYKSDQGYKWREQLTSVRSKSSDTIQASCSKLKGSENDTEEIQRCKNDTEDTQRCKIDAGETQCCKNDTNDTQRCKNDTEDTQRCKNDIEQLCKNDTEQHCELEDGCKTGNNSENKSNGTDKSPTKQLPSLHELEESLEKVETFREWYIRCENSETCGEVMALKIIFEYDVLLILYESGHLKLWCLRNEKCWSTLNLFQETQEIGSHCPMAVDFVKKYGIVVGSSNDLFVFELERAAYIEYNRLVLHYAKLVKSRTLTMTNPGASCVKIREDGEYFMVGCWDGRIRVFSGQSFQLIVVLDGHRFSSPVQDIVFASKSMDSWPGENVSASAGMDGRLCLWKSLYWNNGFL